MDFHDIDFNRGADTVLDIANETLHHDREARAEGLKDAYDCVAQHGKADGAALGHYDYTAGYVQDHPAWSQLNAGKAITQCQVVEHADQGFQPYLTTNALAAVGQILFLPTEANVGEHEQFEAQHEYARGHAAGYREQVHNEFQQGIDAHFQTDMSSGSVVSNSHLGGYDIPALSVDVSNHDSQISHGSSSPSQDVAHGSYSDLSSGGSYSGHSDSSGPSSSSTSSGHSDSAGSGGSSSSSSSSSSSGSSPSSGGSSGAGGI